MNIKVDLSKFLKSKSKFALVYINPNIQKTVIEVTAHICRLFGIPNEDSGSNTNYEKYSLFDGVWFIHPHQSSQLFSSLEGRILRLSFDENSCLSPSPHKPINTLTPLESLDQPSKHSEEITETIRVHDVNALKRKESEINKYLDNNLDAGINYSEKSLPSQFGSGIKSDPENQIFNQDSKDVQSSPYVAMDVESEKMSQNPEEKDSIYSVDENSSVTSVEKRRKRSRKHNRSKRNKKMDFDLSLVTADWVVPKTLTKSNPGNFHYKSKNYSSDPAKINRNHKVFTDEDDEEDKGVLHSSSTKDVYSEFDTSYSQSYPNGNRDDQLYQCTPTQTQTLDSDASSLQIDSLIELKKKELLNSLSRSTSLSHAANSAPNTTPNELLLNHDLDSMPFIEATPEKSSPTTQQIKSRKFKLSPPNGSNPMQPRPESLLKFKNLLALERRSNPKVFCRWEQDTISMQDGWESLPLSFGSRNNRAEFNFNKNSKQSNYDTFKQNPSKNMYNSNSPSNSYIQQNFPKINGENVSDSISFSTPIEQNGNLLTKDFIGNNVNNSISLSPAIEPNETPVIQNFIGARPQKQNKRYYMSVGNVLKALKAPSDRPENGVEENPEIALLSTEHSQRSTDQNWENTNKKDDDVERKGRVRKEDSVEEVMLEEGNNIGNDVSQVEDVTLSCPAPKEWRPLPKEENSRMKTERLNGSENGCDDAPIFVNLCDEKIITYESYPILSSLPKIQDIIAMKLLSLDANMCPCYSEYRPAKVVSLNGLNIGLEFLDGNSGTGLPPGTVTKDGVSQLDWRDLKFPRLLFP